LSCLDGIGIFVSGGKIGVDAILDEVDVCQSRYVAGTSTAVLKDVDAILELLELCLARRVFVLFDHVEPFHSVMDGKRLVFLALEIIDERLDCFE
jgi:hypothetical protein